MLTIYPIQSKITSQTIRDIYTHYIQPNANNEYKFRYETLPLHRNTGSWKWEGKDLPRVIALLEFDRFIVQHNIVSKKGLAVNGLDPEWDYIKSETIKEILYDEETENYDLHTLNLPEKDFDFVMVNQTLEHVYNPVLCLKNIYAHMRRGGILYLNVPVNSFLHGMPFHHYTGLTPVGLGTVVKAAGFRILTIGQWGNLEYLTHMHTSKEWPDYRRFNKAGLNDIDNPIITWIFAIKD